VEVECQDCHGTTKAYPWELPLGYGDEFGLKPKQGPGRGVATTVAAYLKQGSVEDAPEGYLLSARGNPLVHTERKGEQVVVHLASGKDLTLTPLKALKMQGRLSEAALSAMDRIAAHTDTLECYACHAAWAPQRYGSRMKIDYSGGKQAMNHPADLPEHNLSGMTDKMPDAEHSFTEGKVTETPSYLRWENPPLSVNGEGRVSPTIPGYQVALTVIGQEGKAIVENAIPKTPDAEGAGEAGRNAITMAAVQPHTITKRSRSCESCHSDPKAAGYGTDHGRLRPDLTRDTVIDLMTADGRVLSHNTEVRIAGIAGLKDDWDRFVDENGTPLQTVGSDWRLSSPLSNAQRSRLDRSGVCLSCHKSIPEGDPAVGVMAHMAQFAGVKVDNDLHHMVLNKSMRVGAWAQLIGGAIGVLFILYLLKIIFFGSRKKERRWK
jgi:hypothetical protein